MGEVAADKVSDPLESVFKSTNHVETEFCEAAKSGDIKTLSKHISLSCDINCRDVVGKTALHYACQEGHYECVKLLVANGASPEMFDSNRVYPLHLAARGRHLTIIKFLIMSNAKWNVVCKSNCYPIDFVPYDTEAWQVLYNASLGKLPVLDHLVQTRDVPLIPVHAVQAGQPKSAKSKGGKGKKGGKKGGKKSGKKKGGKKKKK